MRSIGPMSMCHLCRLDFEVFPVSLKVTVQHLWATRSTWSADFHSWWESNADTSAHECQCKQHYAAQQRGNKDFQTSLRWPLCIKTRNNLKGTQRTHPVKGFILKFLQKAVCIQNLTGSSWFTSPQTFMKSHFCIIFLTDKEMTQEIKK